MRSIFSVLNRELWESHRLFRLSISLFGLHDAAALQQGFPPLHYTGKCLASHSHMLGWSQSTRPMGISCTCSPVCVHICEVMYTRVQKCDISCICCEPCTCVNKSSKIRCVQLLCLDIGVPCSHLYDGGGSNSYSTLGM